MESARTTELSLDPYVRAAAAGDREAFARIIDATRSLVSSIALAILRDLDLSRDVAQDVFLAAWRDLRKLRDPASFLPWLRQMTRNRAHEVARNRHRHERRVVTQAVDGLLAAAIDPRPDALERLVSQEEIDVVIVALEQLPSEAREVITLYYREGQSVRQVAELLGLSEDAVKKRLSRARSRLREAVLARAGAALEQTTPDSNFTAAVLFALGPAAPGVGSAAGAGLTKLLGGSGTVAKILAASSGALLGGAFGLAAVLTGSHQLQRKALDERERRDLRRFTMLGVVTVLAAVVAMPLAGWLTPGAWPQIVIYAAFLVSLSHLYRLRLPRIIQRRLEVELRADPDAWRRHRRQRIASRIAWILGMTAGTAGLIAGLLSHQ